LSEAHDKGIIHGDIKSTNILISNKGQIKIMDFGLAKLAGPMQLKKTSTVLGTVSYMSQEQVRHENVDHRTDIWSLGAILYEMLAGQLPFRGEYESSMIYSILNEEPSSVEGVRPDCHDCFQINN
jgi:serine/threonine protein kinase